MRTKSALVVLLAVLASSSALAARSKPAASPDPIRYHLGLLWRGPAWTAERTPATDSIQVGHMANIERMVREGLLLGAGPFGSQTALRGVFFFRADTAYDLNAVVSRDPAISSRRLRLEMMPFIAPPGMSEAYWERNRAGLPDSMIMVSWVFLRRGPQWTSNVPPKVSKLLREHREYTAQLKADGHLPFAGGIEGTGDLRGVLIFRGDTTSARRLTDLDPAIKAGRFRAEIHPWWTGLGVLPGF